MSSPADATSPSAAALKRLRAADRAYRDANLRVRTDPAWRDPDDILDTALGDLDPDDPELREAADSDKAAVSLLAALARADLAAGRDGDAARLANRALARDANNLHLQALARQASGEPDDPELADRFCVVPFEGLETAPGGQVYFCCPAWLPVPIGNLGDSDAASVWNSEPAREIRSSILDGSYRYCSRTHCPKLSGRTLPRRDEVKAPRLKSVIDQASTAMDRGPRRIVLSHDRSCNLSCPSCRNSLIVARKAEQAALNAMADAVLFPLFRHARRLRVTASGDPFGSAHFQYVLRNLDRAENPDLVLDLQTNGVLLTPKLWERLRLEGRVDQLIVSADAAEAETYSRVRRGGDFEVLLENLSFMADLRRADRIRHFRLDFVVQAENFAEMGAFADLGRAVGADAVKFQMIRSWGTWSPKEFALHDISDRAHPDYPAFLNALRDPRLAEAFCEFWGMGRALADARAPGDPAGEGA